MDTYTQAACDTATLIRQTVPNTNDPARAAIMLNLCRVAAYRSPVRVRSDDPKGPTQRPDITPVNDQIDEDVIKQAIAYAQSKGAA